MIDSVDSEDYFDLQDQDLTNYSHDELYDAESINNIQNKQSINDAKNLSRTNDNTKKKIVPKNESKPKSITTKTIKKREGNEAELRNKSINEDVLSDAETRRDNRVDKSIRSAKGSTNINVSNPEKKIVKKTTEIKIPKIYKPPMNKPKIIDDVEYRYRNLTNFAASEENSFEKINGKLAFAKILHSSFKNNKGNFINQVFYGDKLYSFYFDLDKFEGSRVILLRQLATFIEMQFGIKPTFYITDCHDYYGKKKNQVSSRVICHDIIGYPQCMKKFIQCFYDQVKPDHCDLNKGTYGLDLSVYPNPGHKGANLRCVLQRKGIRSKGQEIPTGIHFPAVTETLDESEISFKSFESDLDIINYIVTVDPVKGLNVSEHIPCIYERPSKSNNRENDKRSSGRQSIAEKIVSSSDDRASIESSNESESNDERRMDTIHYGLDKISRLILEIIKKKRADNYETWKNIGMALKKSFGDDAFELFVNFSKQSKNFKSEEDVEDHWDTWNKDSSKKCYNAGSIVIWADEDNKKKTDEILERKKIKTPEAETMIAQYLIDNYLKKNLTDTYDYFFWTKEGTAAMLYVWSDTKKNWLYDKKGSYADAYGALDRFLIKVATPHFRTNATATKLLSKQSSRHKIIDVTSSLLDFKEDIQWDANQYDLAYTNGVLNVLTGEFREKTPQDFMRISTNRIHKKPSQEKINEIKAFMRTVFHKVEIYNYMMKVYSTCLCGKVIEHFFILNNSGSNAKSTVTDLMVYALGDYAIMSKSALLTGKSTSNSDPFMAALDKKRAVFWREPEEDGGFNNPIVKELTGGGKIAARDLYENGKKTQKLLCGTFMCECNSKPLMQKECGYAEARRIRDVQFGSKFVKNPADVDEDNGIFLAKTIFKEDSWRESIADALIYFLIDFLKDVHKKDYFLDEPQEIIERSATYMSDSSTICGFIENDYDKENSNLPDNEKTIIKLQDLYDAYVAKMQMGPAEKRTKSVRWFKTTLMDHFKLKDSFFERKKINGKDNYAILLGYKSKFYP